MRDLLLSWLVTLFLIACSFGLREDTGLISAARAGDVALIRKAAAAGADLNAPAGSNGWTPLMHAVHKGQMAAAAALLEAGADPNRASTKGVTPLMMAAGYGNEELVRLLLSRGASCDQRDKGGESALDYALSGTADVDRFTLFDCQTGTVRILAAADGSDLRASGSARRWAGAKRCTEALALLR